MHLRRYGHETFHEKVKMLPVLATRSRPPSFRIAAMAASPENPYSLRHRACGFRARAYSAPRNDELSRSRDAIASGSLFKRQERNPQYEGGEAPKGAVVRCPHRRVRARPQRRTLASRRSTAVFAAQINATAKLRATFPGTCARQSAACCPNPAEAPRGPVIVPAEMMPEPPGDRVRIPPAGHRIPLRKQDRIRMRPSLERDTALYLVPRLRSI